MLSRSINSFHVAKDAHENKCHVCYRMTSTTQQKSLFKAYVTQLSTNNVIIVVPVAIIHMNSVYDHIRMYSHETKRLTRSIEHPHDFLHTISSNGVSKY